MLSHFSPPPPALQKQIMRYESNKPVKSKLTDRQSINQPKGLQWRSMIDWLILHFSGKIALRV